MSLLPKATTSSDGKSASKRPAWLTDEAGSVAALLQEVAFVQKKKEAGFFTTDKEIRDALTESSSLNTLSNTALEPIKKIMPNEEIFTKFLHKYVIARSGRMESAAERVLAFAELLVKYPHLSTKLDSDIMKGMKLEVMDLFPIRQLGETAGELEGCINFAMRFKNMDWGKINDDVEIMEKYWFWVCYVLIMIPSHAAQLHGVVVQCDCEDVASSNIKMSFEMFALRLMSHCLPIRMRAFWCYNAPRFLTWLVWPPMKVAVPKKMQERIHWIDEGKQKEIRDQVGNDDDFWKVFGGSWIPSGEPCEESLQFIESWTKGSSGKVELPVSAAESSSSSASSSPT